MGLSSSKSKSKSTNAPSTFSMPYIQDAASALKPGFAAATANNASLQPRINSALDFSQGTMNGNFLNGNPHLQGVIDAENRDATNAVSSRFEGAGRYGSGNYSGVLAQSILDNENKLRYGDYAQERSYQNDAPRTLANLAAVSSSLPQAAGSTYADQIRALLGQYNTTTGTQTTNPGIGGILGGIVGSGLAGWASGGFKGV